MATQRLSHLGRAIYRAPLHSFQLHRTNLYLQSGTVGAGDSKTEPCPNGCGPLWPVTWETWAREGWAEAKRLNLENAALSAQPSPGGQGVGVSISDDDRAVLQRLQDALPTAGINGWAKGVEVLERLLRDSLAARQPVGEPITVEVVAEIFNHPEYGLSINWLLENGIGELQVGDVLMVSDRAITDEDGSGEVYAAPPAQAVDLGAVREALQAAEGLATICTAIDGYSRDEVAASGRAMRQQFADALAKVNSQAVGNG
ncbi:hypothetical protein [Stenotrophomonas maltophilia]|uniref:hypothetical protein n=1 Tax=Stenotrophomonas maltophilia TaxID=40324 RepID=UPI0011806562|nr:hypothetical protein [Stenotrophomonas maltophilia]